MMKQLIVVIIATCCCCMAVTSLEDQIGDPSSRDGHPSDDDQLDTSVQSDEQVEVKAIIVDGGKPTRYLNSSTTASPSGGKSTGGGRKKKQRLIRGSKNAVTITKKEYLKKDWCKTEPFQQIVDEPGCVKRRIMNRFCYGQCNSFFIPKTEKKELDASGGYFRSCAYCTPKTIDWVTVVLSCPRRNPPVVRKRIQIVRQCKCVAVRLD